MSTSQFKPFGKMGQKSPTKITKAKAAPKLDPSKVRRNGIILVQCSYMMGLKKI